VQFTGLIDPASWVVKQQLQLLVMTLCIAIEGSQPECEFVRCPNAQGEFEKKWQKEVTNKLTDAANATRAEEKAAVRASTEAAQVPVLHEPWLATSFRGCSGALLWPTCSAVVVGSADVHTLLSLNSCSAGDVCLCRPPAQRG
jgi:hypothetical protein